MWRRDYISHPPCHVTGDQSHRDDGSGARRRLLDSRPAWPQRTRAHAGAPNVVIVLCDDLGFADLGCFGSEIETPHIDQQAARGLRYTNFHTAALCVPSRAALLTGVNPHLTGLGWTTEDYGFPGYRGQLADNVLTAGEIFRANGYSTFALGKWGVTPYHVMHDAGDRATWPLQRGFDRFYGILHHRTNILKPDILYEDNHVVQRDAYPEDYVLTDDITDRAISMVRASKASDPQKPFFLYLAHPAPHSPLAARASDIAKYRSRYDGGWDVIRQERFDRQKQLGLLPDATELAPRNHEPDFGVAPWDTLSLMQKELFPRYMEVYAAMVDNIDRSFGRLLSAIDELGELENTVIFFSSDNGASREGGENGTTELERNIWTVFNRLDAEQDHLEQDYARRDFIGSARYSSHYPRGWAMAGNTPFRLYKSTTFAGGHQVPLIVSWPANVAQPGGIRRQYVYVTCLLPTLVDLLSLSVPDTRDGKQVHVFSGTSFATSLNAPDAPSEHREQYYELRGERGFYRDGWEIVSLHYPGAELENDEWQLYHVAEDPTQLADLGAEHPERLAELDRAFDDAAWANQVYPIDHDATGHRFLSHPDDGDVPARVVLYPTDHTLAPIQARKLIYERSFTIEIALSFSHGDRGTLVAHGDQGCGYVLYILDDRLAFAVNAYGTMEVLDGGPLAAGVERIVLDVAAPGGGVWDASLTVDGGERASLVGLPMWTALRPLEGIDVGIDRRSPVSWDLHERHGTFPYSGVLKSVTYIPREHAPDAAQKTAIALREQLLRDD